MSRAKHDTDKIVREYADFRKDYLFDDSIFSQEDERIARVKYVVNKKLSVWERTVILYYAELGSVRRLAEKFGIGRQLAWATVKKIQDKIKAEL